MRFVMTSTVSVGDAWMWRSSGSKVIQEGWDL